MSPLPSANEAPQISGSGPDATQTGKLGLRGRLPAGCRAARGSVVFKRKVVTIMGAAGAGVLLFGAGANPQVHWGYEGTHGPEHWGSLDPGFALCSSGREQSPIDLTGAEPGDLSEIVFNYAPSPISILNNGHTIQVDYQPGSAIVLDGTRYGLIQFHFHHRSEHTVDGGSFPLELHLVHANADGALAVVGIFLEEGAANEALAPVWQHLPAEAGPAAVVRESVDAAALLPERRTTWRYAGSRTTPPCSEGVSWLVMTEPVTASREQIEAFSALFPVNNRPLQPLNGRRLVTDGAG